MASSGLKSQLSHAELAKIGYMKPGMWLDIQAQSPTAIKRAKTDLIGIDFQREILILRMPDENKWGNLRDAIYADAELILRFILEHDAGEVIAFKSGVKAVLSSPMNYILVVFPKRLESHALRSEQRILIKTPVSLLDEQEQKPICSGYLVDISHTGCRVEIEENNLPEQAEPGQRIAIALKRPNGKDIKLTGAIKNIKKELDKTYLGVKFESSKQVVDDLMMQMMVAE